jgi:hypothetical protein
MENRSPCGQFGERENDREVTYLEKARVQIDYECNVFEIKISISKFDLYVFESLTETT